MRFISIPEWIFKGARVAINSSVFGSITAIITDVTDRTVSYKPERRNADYSCAMTIQSMVLMYAEGLIRPVL